MDAKELRTRTVPELADELVKLRKEQFSLRMQRATGQQPKPALFAEARRNIARLKTVLREKRSAAAGGKDKGAHAKQRRVRRRPPKPPRRVPLRRQRSLSRPPTRRPQQRRPQQGRPQQGRQGPPP